MTDSPARFTPLEKMLSMLLVVVLIGFVFFVAMNRDSPKTEPPVEEIFEPEAPDTSDANTIKEYEYDPADRLPAVEGDSGYHWDPKKKILRFSYNVWPGWLPVIAANHGTRPNTDSIFYRKYGFRVEMVLMDNPVAARKAFASGEVHTLWGSVDMMVLLAGNLMKDSRTAPRIVQQMDWSSGGDAIVVRTPIRTVRELGGKTIAVARYSRGEYYLDTLLLSAGLLPADIKMHYTATAFEAAAALVAEKSVDACISWSPDIYRIPARVAGTRILFSTRDALRLIADVYAVRADFARDHPEIVEGLVAGIFDGMDYVKRSPEHGILWMADALGMEVEDVMDARSDAHSTDFAENVQFFLNSSNPVNFERAWRNASYLYRELGRLRKPVPFDQVMDFTFLQRLKNKGIFANQKNEIAASFTPAHFRKVPGASSMLTQPVRIGFYPNSANPYEPARDKDGKEIMGSLYDANAYATLERAARLSHQFARATILIEGHTDSSLKGRISAYAARKLSLSRAEAIRGALMEQFKFDPKRFKIETEGRGWEISADADDPDNRVLNRRVEISVFSPRQ